MLPNFLKDFFFQKNPYDKIMDSISLIRNEHRNKNKLGFIGDHIVIRKKSDQYDINHSLLLPDGQALNMSYTLELSAREFLPPKIDIQLEAHGEAVIEQNSW